MIIFAGIHEVTKELDDLAVYSFKNKSWTHLFKDPAGKKQKNIINPLDASSNKLRGQPNNSPTRINASYQKQKTKVTDGTDIKNKKKPKKLGDNQIEAVNV